MSGELPSVDEVAVEVAHQLARNLDPLDADMDGDGIVDGRDGTPTEVTGDQIHFLHTDQLGGTAVVTDVARNVVRRIQYDVWGEIREDAIPAGAPASTPSPREGFTGQARDPGTDLLYYGARFYDPESGRFLQPDPIIPAAFDPQSLNRFAYVRNDPLNLVDPTGNISQGQLDELSNWAARGIRSSITIGGPFGGSGIDHTMSVMADRSDLARINALADAKFWADLAQENRDRKLRENLPFRRDRVEPAVAQSVDIHVRSFAPWESFGGGFAGDDRTFSTDLNATSRIHGTVTINPATGEVIGQPSAVSSRSSCAGPPCSTVLGDAPAVGSPTITARNVNGAIVIKLAGANPLAPLFDIDLSLTLRVGPSGFSGSLVGDAFPNAEVFVVGPGGASMLHTFSTPGGPITGPFRYLPGANARPMGGF